MNRFIAKAGGHVIGLGSVVGVIGVIAVAATLSTVLTGCSHVAPYERGVLAHPTMTSGDLAGPSEAHVRAVHEGAVGGGAAAESGCGCN
jgi:hypothetical protein